MSQLTLRLPESLHQQLANLAEKEGVSLDQYIIDVLSQQVQSAYSVRQISEAEIVEQEQSFVNLRQRLRSAPPEEIKLALAQREQVEPDAELDPEAVARLRQLIRDRSNLNQDQSHH